MNKAIIPSKYITKLDLSNSGLKEIPIEIFELKNLRKLNLSDNQIKTIPKEISNLKLLEVLDLSNNKVNNFFSKLCELKSLKNLNLNNNQISTLPKQIHKLKQIRRLSISNNKLKSLPPEFSELNSLVSLNISKNYFIELPHPIFNLKELTHLWICDLPLTNFSASLFHLNLKKLKSLYAFSPDINKLQINLEYFELTEVVGNSMSKLKEKKLNPITSSPKEIDTLTFGSIKKASKKDMMIFISYSHQDEIWLKKVQTNLKVLKHQNVNFEIWDDTKILIGQKWKEEIEKALDKSKVAILLISTDFLASDFIQNDELPTLLRKAEINGCEILPLIVGHSRFTKDKKLSVFQAVNNTLKPLNDCTKSEVEKELVKLTDRVEDILK